MHVSFSPSYPQSELPGRDGSARRSPCAILRRMVKRTERRDFLKHSLGAAAGLTFGSSILSALAPTAAWANVAIVRKNVKDLTPQERSDYTQAVLTLKGTPSPWTPSLSTYDQFVWWHKKSFECAIDAAHMRPAFLPWHRQLLLLFEQQLSLAAGKQIALPYWDWTDQASFDALFAANFAGGNGDPANGYAVTDGPFARGSFRLNVFDPPRSAPYTKRWIVRNFGAGGFELPTQAEIDDAMSVPTYDVEPYDPSSKPSVSFRNNLEGWRGRTGMACEKGLMEVTSGPHGRSVMHNVCHLYIGGLWGKDFSHQGTMVMNTSPNDPVFWQHHTNIDRLWWQWEQLQGMQYAPASGFNQGQNLNDPMWPYTTIGINTTIAQLLDIGPLGYTYA